VGIISCVPPRPVTTLQSCGHVDCSVVDVGSPCERVELNLVVDDLSASVGGVHQIEAFDFVSASAKASGDPVPDDLRAVVNNVEGGNSWNGWGVHNALEVCLLASESDSAEREMLKRQNRVGRLVEAVSKDGLASSIGSLSVRVGQHGLKCICE